MIADCYKFTWIQKQAFINAVKLLNSSNNDNYNTQQFICVSPQEQSILDQINELTIVLTQYTNNCMKIKQENTMKLETEILKLQEYNKLIQQSFDNAINELILKCTLEVNSTNKQFENLQSKINKELNDLRLSEAQFKQYLSTKTQDKSGNNNNFDSIKQIQSSVNEILCDDDACIVPISIKNDLNVNTLYLNWLKK